MNGAVQAFAGEMDTCEREIPPERRHGSWRQSESDWGDAEQMEQIPVIPTGASLLASDAAFFGRLPFEQVECQAAQGREVLGSMARTGPRLVFSEADVHVPVHLVLDTPMAAHRLGEAGDVAREAGEVVTALG